MPRGGTWGSHGGGGGGGGVGGQKIFSRNSARFGV